MHTSHPTATISPMTLEQRRREYASFLEREYTYIAAGFTLPADHSAPYLNADGIYIDPNTIIITDAANHTNLSFVTRDIVIESFGQAMLSDPNPNFISPIDQTIKRAQNGYDLAIVRMQDTIDVLSEVQSTPITGISMIAAMGAASIIKDRSAPHDTSFAQAYAADYLVGKKLDDSGFMVCYEDGFTWRTEDDNYVAYKRDTGQLTTGQARTMQHILEEYTASDIKLLAILPDGSIVHASNETELKQYRKRKMAVDAAFYYEKQSYLHRAVGDPRLGTFIRDEETDNETFEIPLSTSEHGEAYAIVALTDGAKRLKLTENVAMISQLLQGANVEDVVYELVHRNHSYGRWDTDDATCGIIQRQKA